MNTKNNLALFDLDIRETITEGFSLYKKSFKVIILIAFFQFLIYLLNIGSTYTMSFFIRGLLTGFLLVVLLIVVVVYLGSRLTVALFLCFSEYHGGNSISFREIFQLSRDYVWRYIGVSILYALMFIPFILVEIFIIRNATTVLIKTSLTIIIVIAALYLATVFKFAPVAAIFEKSETRCFKLSKGLVKGTTVKVQIFIAAVLTFSLLLGYSATDYNPLYKPLGAEMKLVLMVLRHVLTMFIEPLVISITFVMYTHMKRKVVYRQ